MGCIVNGPGEMADADFGYVGGAPGKIDLYVGKVLFLTRQFISSFVYYMISSINSKYDCILVLSDGGKARNCNGECN